MNFKKKNNKVQSKKSKRNEFLSPITYSRQSHKKDKINELKNKEKYEF